jgi:hypothetical protein
MQEDAHKVVGVEGGHVEVAVPARGPVPGTLHERRVLVQPHPRYPQQLRRHVAESGGTHTGLESKKGLALRRLPNLKVIQKENGGAGRRRVRMAGNTPSVDVGMHTIRPSIPFLVSFPRATQPPFASTPPSRQSQPANDAHQMTWCSIQRLYAPPGPTVLRERLGGRPCTASRR